MVRYYAHPIFPDFVKAMLSAQTSVIRKDSVLGLRLIVKIP
jgi:hypothetical protein